MVAEHLPNTHFQGRKSRRIDRLARICCQQPNLMKAGPRAPKAGEALDRAPHNSPEPSVRQHLASASAHPAAQHRVAARPVPSWEPTVHHPSIESGVAYLSQATHSSSRAEDQMPGVWRVQTLRSFQPKPSPPGTAAGTSVCVRPCCMPLLAPAAGCRDHDPASSSARRAFGIAGAPGLVIEQP